MVNYHLVVLVHGLWGNSSHLEYIEKQLYASAPESNEKLIVHRTGSHSGYLTYDGIDINGKRTSDEIIHQTELLAGQGDDKVVKFSIVGYSLGGLIARYAIGILYSKNYFEDIEPINFTTFCSPHVGVLDPMNNHLSARLFNRFAPYFLAHSGSQLFLKDKIGSNASPLLVWMANPASVFFKSLKGFKHHSLYSNILNDKRTCWFTSAISSSDPYNSMTNKSAANVQVSYIEGYEPTVVDFANPGGYKPSENPPTSTSNSTSSFNSTPTSSKIFGTVSSYAFRLLNMLKIIGSLVVYTPLWSLYFISSSILERVKLNKRVHTFLQDTSNNLVYLYDSIDESVSIEDVPLKEDSNDNDNDSYYENFEREIANQVSERQDSLVERVYDVILSADAPSFQPENQKILNLSDDQKYIVDQLNSLNWSRFPIIIRNSTHTHAAAIVRFSNPDFDEGKVVVKHFTHETFKYT